MKVSKLVGKENAEKLVLAKIRSVESLLKRGALSEGRELISRDSGLAIEEVAVWLQKANLMRIPGVGVEYSTVLFRLGFRCPLDLVDHTAESILKRMAVYNSKGNEEVRLPALTQVEAWLERASELSELITS